LDPNRPDKLIRKKIAALGMKLFALQLSDADWWRLATRHTTE
jgi:hypothetical protein